MTYNPGRTAIRCWPEKLKQHIQQRGPLTIAQYMAACLNDSEYGYYVTQDAIGRGGDFITAPEISQVFGELIGLWCAVAWRQMGMPNPTNIVELRPGHGAVIARHASRNLARTWVPRRCPREALRAEPATARHPDTLAEQPIPVAHADPSEPPEGATLMVANEVMDCIPMTSSCARSVPTAIWLVHPHGGT